MATIRLFTIPHCKYCVVAKHWMRTHGCEYDELDVTASVDHLREWRALTGGGGVPVLAHGEDIIIGFSEERWAQMLECCRNTSEVESEIV